MGEMEIHGESYEAEVESRKRMKLGSLNVSRSDPTSAMLGLVAHAKRMAGAYLREAAHAQSVLSAEHPSHAKAMASGLREQLLPGRSELGRKTALSQWA